MCVNCNPRWSGSSSLEWISVIMSVELLILGNALDLRNYSINWNIIETETSLLCGWVPKYSFIHYFWILTDNALTSRPTTTCLDLYRGWRLKACFEICFEVKSKLRQARNSGKAFSNNCIVNCLLKTLKLELEVGVSTSSKKEDLMSSTWNALDAFWTLNGQTKSPIML